MEENLLFAPFLVLSHLTGLGSNGGDSSMAEPALFCGSPGPVLLAMKAVRTVSLPERIMGFPEGRGGWDSRLCLMEQWLGEKF